MGLFCESIFVEILFTLLLVIWLVYKYLTKDYNYWKDRGVPYQKTEFPFGSMKDLLLARKTYGEQYENIYNQFPKERFYGIIDLHKPVLVLRNLKLIEDILKKNSLNFIDKESLGFNPKDPMTNHLFNMKGQEWKYTRSILSPTFSSGKLKMAFPLVEKSGEMLKGYVDSQMKDKNVVNANDAFARFTLDVSASVVYGVDSKALLEKDAVFYNLFVQSVSLKRSKIAFLIRTLVMNFPIVIRLFHINITSPARKVFLDKLVRDVIEYQQKTYVNINSMLETLISIRHKKRPSDESEYATTDVKCDSSEGLTFNELVTHSNMFLGAGFDASGSLMAFCLFELSCHQEIQQRLYQEIKEAVDKTGGKITYETLKEVSYLHQVIKETQRLYGSAQLIDRVSTRPFKIPDSDLVLEKGQKVVIPLYALHHDPQHYPDPYKFKPERFTEEETKKRHYSSFLPFGGGPRMCIGGRFALLQVRMGIATVVLNYQAHLSPDQEVPVKLDAMALPLTPLNPILLKFEKRKTI